MNLTLRRAAFVRAPRREHRQSVSLTRWLFPRRLLLALLLVLSLSALPSSETQAQTQSPAPSDSLPKLPKPLILDMSGQPPPPQFYLGKEFPKEELPIVVTGDGKQWWIVNFEKIPLGITVKVKDEINGYSNSQQLEEGRWYALKAKLPLQISIGTHATTPVSLRIKTGFLTDTSQSEVGTEGPAYVNRYVNESGKPDRIIEKSSYPINFYYGEIAFSDTSNATSPTATPSATPTVSPSGTRSDGDRPWWIYVLPVAVLFLVIAVVLFLRSRSRDDENINVVNAPSGFKSPRQSATVISSEKEGWFGNLLHRRKGDRKGEAADAAASTPAAPAQSAPVVQTPTPPANAQINPPRQVGNQPESTNGQAVDGITAEQLEALRQDIKKLWQALNGKQNDDPVKVQDLIKGIVKQEISSTKSTFNGEIRGQGDAFKKRLDELEEKLKKEIKEGTAAVTRGIEPTVRNQMQPVTDGQAKLKELFAQVSTEQSSLRERVDTVVRTIADQVDELYMEKVLGFVLENRVDILRQEKFELLIDEMNARLDKFFREEVGRGGDDDLDDLQARAESIKRAFREVVEKMVELKVDGDGEARQVAERADVIIAEMGVLRTQLKDRQLDIKATVHIPVSAHSRARYTFLEELGPAIRREITKLSDPLMHFESELERLATSEVVALADICDRRFNPGLNKEMEERLQKLFEQANLKDILPKAGGRFEAGYQELLEMVDGKPNDSLRVAQVVARGFIYKQDGTETLLRKAKVKIYR
jgi:hypothetical protein